MDQIYHTNNIKKELGYTKLNGLVGMLYNRYAYVFWNCRYPLGIRGWSFVPAPLQVPNPHIPLSELVYLFLHPLGAKPAGKIVIPTLKLASSDYPHKVGSIVSTRLKSVNQLDTPTSCDSTRVALHLLLGTGSQLEEVIVVSKFKLLQLNKKKCEIKLICLASTTSLCLCSKAPYKKS